MNRPLALVVALAENGVIGRDNRLIWRLKSDLRRFRELTWGKPVLMGRKTFEAIGKPLPGRDNIVLTRSRSFAAPGIEVAHDWNEALARAEAAAERLAANEVAVIGGAEIYKLALPQAQKLHLTLVHAEPDGDAVFPPYDSALFREVSREPHPSGADDEHPFTFIDLERRRPAATG